MRNALQCKLDEIDQRIAGLQGLQAELRHHLQPPDLDRPALPANAAKAGATI